MGEKFKERILNLSDDDLLNLYEICYADYRAEVLEYAKEEILKRNIEKKVWFYNDWSEEYGPYSRDEIIKLVSSGEVKTNYNIWYEGLDDWIGLENINIFGNQIKEINLVKEDEQSNKDHILRPPTFNPATTKTGSELKSYDYEAAKSGVKLAGILLTIVGVIYVLLSVLQLFAGLVEQDIEYYIYAGWNTIVSIAMIIIAQGLIKCKKWSYSWGKGTAGINIILHVIDFIYQEINLNIFLFIIHVAILILLLKNKKIFENDKDEQFKATN